MKWQKNPGEQPQDILQNQFTAYVTRAVHNRRIRYLMQQSTARQAEAALWETEAPFPDFQDAVQRFLDMEAIRYALKQIRERERRIVLARVVEEKSFPQIAQEQGMTYKAVTSLYYRAIAKLRSLLEGGGDGEF